MKAVIQRVSSAKVCINQDCTRTIGAGLVIFLGVMQGDTELQAEWLAKKIVELRIFSDENDKMNRSVLDESGELLVISNFTLGADCRKGTRPSYDKAAHPSLAEPLYQAFLTYCKAYIPSLQTGEFGADMQVTLTNDGPVTIIIDTADKPNLH